MTSSALAVEPACPGPVAREDLPSSRPPSPESSLSVERTPFAALPRAVWDLLVAASPWATPFSGWAFHRAWWDAYGTTAHDQTLVVTDRATDRTVAIVPLMHRHEVEPSDAETHTTIRHGHAGDLTNVAPTAKAVFFGASYHADYATVLAASDALPAVAEAVVAYLASEARSDNPHPDPWDVVDLRRLRCGDPAADALAVAFARREMTEGWTLNVEREDVCPVLTLPPGVDFDGYLATLGKKDRHEIRRKIRRAETLGEIRLTDSPEPLADLEAFIDLHQRKWGDDGLFPPTPGGDMSRVFLRRLFEEHGPEGPIRLSLLTVADRLIAAGILFLTQDGYLYYNAGVDPEARDLSPGVLMVAAYIQRAITEGCHRVDFLRGNEPYKYEWGAKDEPIQRILVRRDVAAGRAAS